jgi:3-oxoacyl-[acyl-carrier protein] reductase
MDLGITDKVALIGGSSAGLGRGVAEALAEDGCKIVLTGRRAEKLMQTRDQIAERYQVEVLAVPCDMADSLSIESLADQVLGHFGQVDILVNNTGGPPPGTFEEITPEQWADACQLTLFSAQHCARMFLPGMIDAGWGRVINITSISVKQPIPGLMLSNSIRAAVIGWAKTLSDEVAGTGVLVNNVCPGTYYTDRIQELIEERVEREGITRAEAAQAMSEKCPLKRLGDPRELGDVVAFLASDRASFVNGVSLLVDGGTSRGQL